MELAGNTGRGLSRDERSRSVEPSPESRSSGSGVDGLSRPFQTVSQNVIEISSCEVVGRNGRCSVQDHGIAHRPRATIEYLAYDLRVVPGVTAA
jgi:hypothetical protein